MRFILFFAFIAVPLVELALLIKVGEIIGVVATVLLVILTAMIGVILLRIQGLTVLQNARASLDAGRPPLEPVIEGVMLLFAGAFLLTPGLLTDSVGFLLLIPNMRRALARWAFAKLQQMGSIDMSTFSSSPRGGKPGPGPTIEGEYARIDGEEASPADGDDPGRPSGERDDSPWRQ